MKTKLCIIGLLICTFSFCHAQEDQLDRDIKKFLSINGSKESMEPMITQMLGQFRTMKSGVPEEFWASTKLEIIAELPKLYDQLVPIYRKIFTHDEIKGLIKFYESPLGKSLTSKTPTITRQSMQIGQQWGMGIGAKIQAKVQEKGY